MNAPSETPKHPRFPTNPDWNLFDIHDSRCPPSPYGKTVLMINPGGVLMLGPYRPCTVNGEEWVPRYWGYYPGIPEDPPTEFYI